MALLALQVLRYAGCRREEHYFYNGPIEIIIISKTRCNTLSSTAIDLPFSTIPNGKPERNGVASRTSHFTLKTTANVEEGRVEN
jgi:hypothetical protein